MKTFGNKYNRALGSFIAADLKNKFERPEPIYIFHVTSYNSPCPLSSLRVFGRRRPDGRPGQDVLLVLLFAHVSARGRRLFLRLILPPVKPQLYYRNRWNCIFIIDIGGTANLLPALFRKKIIGGAARNLLAAGRNL